jgi:TetR/AcrR family transcriptional repressor of nem operon
MLKAPHDTRERLLEVGLQALRDGSYERTGIQEILARAGVPKGSFYHHFESKQDFGRALMQRYARDVAGLFRSHLEDERHAPLVRVARLFEEMQAGLAREQCRRGCLLGNLAQEMADVNEVMRLDLEALFREQRELLATCLREAIAGGTLDARRDVTALAGFCLAAWQGAVMQMKVRRSLEPLEDFRRFLVEDILGVR